MLADGFGEAVGRPADVLDIAGLLEQREHDFEFGERHCEIFRKSVIETPDLIAEHSIVREDALHFFDVGIFAREEVVLHASVAHR